MGRLHLEANAAKATADDSLRTAEVLIITEGIGNLRDRNAYVPDAIVSCAKVFIGKQFYIDHPSAIDEESRPERSVRDLAGFFESTRVDKVNDPITGDELAACFATLRFADSDPGRLAYDQVRCAIEYQKIFPDTKDVYCGISINAGGLSEPGEIDGEQWNIVHEIEDAFSADIVTKPARGGKFLSLVRESIAGAKIGGRFTEVGDAKFPEPRDAWTTGEGEVPPGIISGDPVLHDSEVAPPGREKQVKALKGKVANPYAVAWASFAKSKQGEAVSTALAGILRKGVGHLTRLRGAKTADVTQDIPLDSFRDDLERKKSLNKMMGTKKESAAVRAFSEAYGGAGMAGTEMHDRTPSMPEAEQDGDKLDKSDPKVNYRYSQDPNIMCATCSHFDETSEEEFGGSCDLVAGVIRGVDVCNLWEAIEKCPAAQEALRVFRAKYRD